MSTYEEVRVHPAPVESTQEQTLLEEAVYEAAHNCEYERLPGGTYAKQPSDCKVKYHFCSLCTTSINSEMPTWEEVEHTPECLVSRARAALSGERKD